MHRNSITGKLLPRPRQNPDHPRRLSLRLSRLLGAPHALYYRCRSISDRSSHLTRLPFFLQFNRFPLPLPDRLESTLRLAPDDLRHRCSQCTENDPKVAPPTSARDIDGIIAEFDISATKLPATIDTGEVEIQVNFVVVGGDSVDAFESCFDSWRRFEPGLRSARRYISSSAE